MENRFVITSGKIKPQNWVFSRKHNPFNFNQDKRKGMKKKELIEGLKKLENRVIGIECSLTSTVSKDYATMKQLQCSEKGHNWVFDKRIDVSEDSYAWISLQSYPQAASNPQYQFKCSNCDLTITYTKDELTPTEKKALKDLGILE